MILEELAERIAAEVEAMPRACRWCCKSLENGHLWCGDECEATWRKRLMPSPSRDEVRTNVPSFERVRQRKADLARAAKWREEHEREIDTV